MKELLVPVGSMESLMVAVHNGCDAVYLGGKRFGARAYANNFTDEEMLKAIKYCHLYGVKIYVTVNTLIYEEELLEVMNYLKFLYASGVDAVIIQDIGLIARTRRELPDLEIHASTQVHSTNNDTVQFLTDLGVKRVVLAREMSIDEIKTLDTNLELEVFIHGALCISYSGECLFSSMLLNRSGNRGTCAQICRLPFKMLRDNEEIKTKGDYLLSTRELNTSDFFKEIMESNIYSLKIEGRMKSPEYVGCVTSLYRDLMDKYYDGKEVIPDKQIMKDLMTIFNREYTKGYLFHASNRELMNIKTSNHLGVKIGEVVEVNKKYIKVKLSDKIYQGDGIRFMNAKEGMIANFIYDNKENLINHGSSGEIVAFANKFKVNVHDIVNKTLDSKLKDKYLNKEKKIPISMHIECSLNREMILRIKARNKEVEVRYGLVSKALKMPVMRNLINKQLNKLGNTPFVLNNLEMDVDDNIFINLKDLNELRRRGITGLTQALESRDIKKIVPMHIDKKEMPYRDEVQISLLARTEEQIRCGIDNNATRIYIPDKSLYEKYKILSNVYYRTNRVSDSAKNYSLITELGSLKRIGAGIGDYYLNICNHETIDYLSKYVELLTLSVELKDEEIRDIMNYYNNKCNVELLIYGTLELMLTKYCPLNLNVNKDKVCHVCQDNHKYYLKDRNEKKYRIINDMQGHYTHIMHYKPIDKRANKEYYYQLGIKNYRLELLDEDYETTKMLINSLNFNN